METLALLSYFCVLVFFSFFPSKNLDWKRDKFSDCSQITRIVTVKKSDEVFGNSIRNDSQRGEVT